MGLQGSFHALNLNVESLKNRLTRQMGDRIETLGDRVGLVEDMLERATGRDEKSKDSKGNKGLRFDEMIREMDRRVREAARGSEVERRLEEIERCSKVEREESERRVRETIEEEVGREQEKRYMED